MLSSHLNQDFMLQDGGKIKYFKVESDTDLLKQTVFAFFSSLLVQAKLNGWHEFELHFILYSANVSSNLFFLDIVLPSSKTFLSYFKVVLSHSSPGFA